MSDIVIDVDGIPVSVGEQEYLADPEAVVREVRAARAEIVGDLTGLHEEAPDYNTLVAAFGEEDGS